jgi:choline dehydrogenase-like flavoprotein
MGPEAVLETDICIVGAGAAGITIAGQLDGTSRDVCLVEAGGRTPDQETQSLYDLENLGYPIRENFMSRARYFGGSCNLWAGRCMRLAAIDFEERPWVPRSGWPIPRAEVEAYCPKAAEILHLPPLRHFDVSSYREKMTADEKALVTGPEIAPRISLWAKSPLRFGDAYKSRLRKSGNLRLLLNANAIGVNLDRDGTVVESLNARTLSGDRLTIRARSFVLACGGLENARLLLVSRDVHPNGVGNRWDLVGRYFMDHPRSVFGKVRLRENSRLPLLRGIPLRDGKVQFGLGLSEEIQRREGLLNHYATFEAQFSEYVEEKYESFVQTMKVLLRRGYAGNRLDGGRAGLGRIPEMIYLLTPKELMPHLIYRWYWHLRHTMNPGEGGNDRVIVYFCEQPPDPESRVTLDAGRDALGVNKLALRWRIGEEVERSLSRLQEVLGESLAQKGVGVVESASLEPVYSDASHHMGTTRMSNDPKRGVVDADCRVHGVSNLFLAGGSVFPTAGHINPTLTIVALALRLADHLEKEAR